MKSTPKVTRVQLKFKEENEFVLLGIVSAEPDYKLSLALNKKFRISLRNVSPVKIPAANRKELSFSRFSDTNATTGIVYDLFSNRSANDYFLKKLKNVDYIFQVHDPENGTQIDILTSRLREMETINAVFHIDLISFKDKNLQYLTQ